MSSVQTARAQLSQHKPHLISSFDRLLADVSPYLGSSDRVIESTLYMAIAGEYLYVDNALLQRAVQRGEYHLLARILRRFSAIDYHISREFLRLYPTLPFQIADIGEPLLQFAEAVGRKGTTPTAALGLCLRRRDPRAVGATLRRFAAIAAAAPAILGEVCRIAETYLARHGWAKLAVWLDRGVDLIESGRVEAGVDHLRLLSHESREILGFRFVALNDVRGVLSIYASSLCGRRLTVTESAGSPYLLENPHTDGQVLFLPARLQCSAVPDENRRAYTALAALQAATISLGTYAFDLRELEVLDSIRDRYGTVLADEMEHLRKLYANRAKTVRERASGDVEAVFADDRVLPLLETFHEEFYFRFPTPDLARELFTLLESARIEGALSRRYPGLGIDFAVVDRWLGRKPVTFTPVNDAYAEVGAVIVSLARRIGLPSLPADGAKPAKISVSDAMRAVRIVFEEGATVYDSAEATFALYTALYDSYELVPFCRQHDIRGLFPAREKLSIYPEVVGAHSPQLLAKRPERTVTISEHADGEQEIDLTSFGAADRESRRIRRTLINGAYSTHVYPEFDYESGGYRRNHCTVYESTLPSGDPGYYEHALKANMLVHKRVKKRFLALQPEEVSISRKWEDGEDIHIGDATDYATSLLMGRTVDEKVYVRKVTNRRDVTVAILLDASSSTAEPISDGTIIDMEKDALAILASALSIIGDRFGIYSYFSMGRSNVFVNVVKSFDDPWNRESQGRIDTVAAHAGNRDGAAIRHVTERLKEEPSKTKLMILLSDGIPADPGYGRGAGTDTNRYALEDTRRALTEQKREGITPFCVTIDRFARSYIPYLYGSYHYTVLDDIALLPERLSRVYLRLTR